MASPKDYFSDSLHQRAILRWCLKYKERFKEKQPWRKVKSTRFALSSSTKKQAAAPSQAALHRKLSADNFFHFNKQPECLILHKHCAV
jgi:hypothetical protein